MDSSLLSPPALRFASTLVSDRDAEDDDSSDNGDVDSVRKGGRRTVLEVAAATGEEESDFASDFEDTEGDAASGDEAPGALPELKLIGRRSRKRGGPGSARTAGASTTRRQRSAAAAVRRKKGSVWINPNGTELASEPRILMKRADGYAPGVRRVSAADRAARTLPFDIEGTDSTARGQRRATRMGSSRLMLGRKQAQTFRLDPLGVPLVDKLPRRAVKRLENSPLRTRARPQPEKRHVDRYAHVTSRIFTSTAAITALGGAEDDDDPLLAMLRKERGDADDEGAASGAAGKKRVGATRSSPAKLFNPAVDTTMYDRYNQDPAQSPSRAFSSIDDELAAARKECDFLRAWGCACVSPTLETLAAARAETARVAGLSAAEINDEEDAAADALQAKLSAAMETSVEEPEVVEETTVAVNDEAAAEAKVAVDDEEKTEEDDEVAVANETSAKETDPGEGERAPAAVEASAAPAASTPLSAGAAHLFSLGVGASDAEAWSAIGAALLSFSSDRAAELAVAATAVATSGAIAVANAAFASAETAAAFAASCVEIALTNAAASSEVAEINAAADAAAEGSDESPAAAAADAGESGADGDGLGLNSAGGGDSDAGLEFEIRAGSPSKVETVEILPLPEWSSFVSPTSLPTATPLAAASSSKASAFGAEEGICTVQLGVAVDRAIASAVTTKLDAAISNVAFTGAEKEAAVVAIASSALALANALSNALCARYVDAIEGVVTASDDAVAGMGTQWAGLALDEGGSLLVQELAASTGDAAVDAGRDAMRATDDAIAAALCLLRANLPDAALQLEESATFDATTCGAFTDLWRAICADWSVLAFAQPGQSWNVPGINALVRAASIGLLYGGATGAAGRADAWCALTTALLPRALVRNDHFALDVSRTFVHDVSFVQYQCVSLFCISFPSLTGHGLRNRARRRRVGKRRQRALAGRTCSGPCAERIDCTHRHVDT